MPDLQHSRDLRARRAEIHAEMTKIAKTAKEEDRKFTAEEREKFDKMHADMSDLKERAEDMEKLEIAERELDEPAGVNRGLYALDDGRVTDRRPADGDKVITRRDTDLALRAWLMPTHASDEMRQAADKCGLDIRGVDSLEYNLLDTNDYQKARRTFREEGIVYRATTAQSKGTNAAGGFTVPTELVTTIEEALLAIRGMRSVATVMRTAAGHDLNIPTADDTATVSSVLAENTAATVSNLTFAQVTMRAAKYSSGIVLASVELLQDTAVDLVGYIGRAIGTRHARGTNRDYTTGSTATTSPRGVIRDTFEGFAATTTSGDISLTSLTELFHSVDIEYRDMPGAGFMAHDGVVKEMAQIVDSNGNPIWRAGLVAGSPDTLLGKPVTVNNRMVSSTTGAGQKTVIFGDLAKYLIRDVQGGQLVRFNERYMEKLQFGWLGFMRTDGKVLLASTRNASKPIAHLKGTT